MQIYCKNAFIVSCMLSFLLLCANGCGKQERNENQIHGAQQQTDANQFQQ